MNQTTVTINVQNTAPAEDTDYRVVMWRDVWRVYNARNVIMAVCETRQEADAYILRQADGR